MITLKLLKPYNGKQAGDTIAVSNNVGFGLLESGVAVQAETASAVKQTELGTTRAFSKAPNRRRMEVPTATEDTVTPEPVVDAEETE